MWIQGEMFKSIADFCYSPHLKHRDDYDNLQNTFDISVLKPVNIVYTHLCYAQNLINIITNLPDYKFILITHSCDCSVVAEGISRPGGNGERQSLYKFEIPTNVVKWYSKNIDVTDSRIESIPIGLENNRWFPHIHKMDKLRAKITTPKQYKNLLYINHNVVTNPIERVSPYVLFRSKGWVTIDKGANGKDFDVYLDNIYNHKFVLSPQGNGIDTHRTWECLYLGTIPIEKRNLNNRFYTGLPICFVDSWEEITEEFLNKEYDRIKNTQWDLRMLDFDYWKNKIYGTLF